VAAAADIEGVEIVEGQAFAIDGDCSGSADVRMPSSRRSVK